MFAKRPLSDFKELPKLLGKKNIPMGKWGTTRWAPTRCKWSYNPGPRNCLINGFAWGYSSTCRDYNLIITGVWAHLVLHWGKKPDISRLQCNQSHRSGCLSFHGTDMSLRVGQTNSNVLCTYHDCICIQVPLYYQPKQCSGEIPQIYQ